ncbi:nucleotidyltransferase [Anaerobacillus sp. MEB173]|uniref:nucleotidyltransferase n=1 Tax=Anaerobacillus sp. MEB173 TaxID=3383345 RepID=UPI003F939817
MNIAGIIVEYNPLHNGHEYHLNQTKAKTNADLLIAVMSGYFLQRGEPAIVSKWTRTKMALEAGADIVIELPYAFSTQKAETFANGAISILDAVGVNQLCFGSEEGAIDSFYNLLSFMNDKESLFNQNVKNYIAEGNSYPKATSLAFSKLENNSGVLDLSQPNNILGYHYIKAIQMHKSSIKASTIQRKNAQYHDETFSDYTFASATSIRKKIFSENNEVTAITSVVPSYTKEHLTNYYRENQLFHNWELYFSYLKYKLLTSTTDQLQQIYEAEEGLEHRFVHYIKKADNFSSFMNTVKTKRYTWNRLQRLCSHILTNTTKSEMELISNAEEVPYIRLLGMTTNGQGYLNKIKKHLNVPLITSLSKEMNPLLALDVRAATCYALGYKKEMQSKRIQEEFSTPPIRYDEKAGLFM